MRIMVLVKSMVDPGCPVGPGLGGVPDAAELAWVANPADLAAAAIAARLRASAGGGTVAVLTLGPPGAEPALRAALAQGADRALRVEREADVLAASPLATAAALAAVLEEDSPDLVLCGAQAGSHHGGQVGPAVAALLGWPHVSSVVSVDRDGRTASLAVERLGVAGRREVMEVPLPSVLAIAPEAEPLEEPGLPAWVAAHSAAVEVVKSRPPRSAAPQPRLVGLGPPRPRPKRIFTPSSDLPAEERIQLLLLGGAKPKQTEVVEGPVELVADQLLQFLLDHGVAPEEADA